MNEDNYFVKLEIFHGVHYGIPGCPNTESYIHDLEMHGEENFDVKVRNYLIDSRLFPTESGYLKAKVIAVSDGNKDMGKEKIVRLSTLELIMGRGSKKNE